METEIAGRNLEFGNYVDTVSECGFTLLLVVWI